jgi:hypothetical protein
MNKTLNRTNFVNAAPNSNLVHQNAQVQQQMQLQHLQQLQQQQQQQQQANMSRLSPNGGGKMDAALKAQQTTATASKELGQRPNPNLSTISNSSASNLSRTINQQSSMPPPPSALSLAASATHTRTLLPRPIIAPNRTFFDKLLDFVIGEGPNNRLAVFLLFFFFLPVNFTL